MKWIFFLFLFSPLTVWCEAQDWQKTLSSPEPGNFPAPHAQKATYRLGWSNLVAGEAEANFTKPENDVFQLDLKARSIGLVRGLWKLDASHSALARASALRPLKVKQIEIYRSKTVTTLLSFNNSGVSSLRILNPPDPVPPVKQKFQFQNLYDLQTALLYIRSQRLQTGDRSSFVVFPGNSPYLATIRVIGRENIQIKTGRYNALKLELNLQKINNQLQLEHSKKFKRAFAWLSDDSDRLVLRAEMEIFVGSIWVELQSIQFTAP
ncbi:MAG: DUF3108 domain-containing protein [Chthoniobacteraceae bacterium]